MYFVIICEIVFRDFVVLIFFYKVYMVIDFFKFFIVNWFLIFFILELFYYCKCILIVINGKSYFDYYFYLKFFLL